MENFIDILKAIVFGIVEGITEWLPVSSTGHMIVLEQFFSLADTQGKEFFDFFVVIIQLGAIIAVVMSFKSLWPFGKNKTERQKREIWRTWYKILIASVPAGVIGLLFDDWLDNYLYNYLYNCFYNYLYNCLYNYLYNCFFAKLRYNYLYLIY